MLRPKPSVQAYLYMEPVDMRKSINGLAALVEQEMNLSPALEAIFVFCNRGRDKIKLLCWERNGFIVWYKRLENSASAGRGRITSPTTNAAAGI